MIFNCSKDIMLNGLNTVVKAVSTHSTMPILSCVLMEANESGIRMAATDVDMIIEVKDIEAEIIETGTVALDAKMLLDIVRRMPDDLIHLSTNNKNVTVLKSGKSEFKILGLDVDEFPKFPVIEKTDEIVLKCSNLKNIVRQTLFAAAVDESKPILTGLLFEITKDLKMSVVAVDGIRVAVKNLLLDETENVVKKEVYAVIPANALSELSKIISSESEKMIYIYFTDNFVLFEMDEFQMVARLLDGEFIKYRQVFNEDCTTAIYINRENFLYCMERAMLITSVDAKKNPVYFKISDGKLTITSRTETGTSFDEMKAEMEGNDIEISFNPKYLADVARVIDEEEMKMQFTSPLSPCTIRGRDNEDYKYLLLPLRIKM